MMGFISHTNEDAAHGGQTNEAVPDFSPEACSGGNILQESFTRPISLFPRKEIQLCQNFKKKSLTESTGEKEL